MKTIDKKTMPEALDLSVELDAIAAGINAVSTYLKDWDSVTRQFDQPSSESLAEALIGLERHLLRVSEDYLTYAGQLEDQIKDLTESGRKEIEA